MAELKWSVQKPTSAGVYWWRPEFEGANPVMVEVQPKDDTFGVYPGGELIQLSNVSGEWAGPFNQT